MSEKNTTTEQIISLPKNLQEYILSEETKERVRSIAKTNGLTEEQAGTLTEEVFITLIGSSDPKNLTSNLVEDGVEVSTAQKISKEAEKDIFSPVKVYLDEIYKEETSSDLDTNAPPPSTNEIPIKNTVPAPENLPTQTKQEEQKPETTRADTSSDLEKTLADLDTILQPDPTTKSNWLHKEVGEKQQILHDIEAPPPPNVKEKSVFEKKLDENLYKQDFKKKPSDDPTPNDEMHKKINTDPYREPIL